MKIISQAFQNSPNDVKIAEIDTFGHNAGATIDWQKKAVT
jgi:hypothetical protein